MTAKETRQLLKVVMAYSMAVFALGFVGMTAVELVNGLPIEEAAGYGASYGLVFALILPMLALFDYTIRTASAAVMRMRGNDDY